MSPKENRIHAEARIPIIAPCRPKPAFRWIDDSVELKYAGWESQQAHRPQQTGLESFCALTPGTETERTGIAGLGLTAVRRSTTMRGGVSMDNRRLLNSLEGEWAHCGRRVRGFTGFAESYSLGLPVRRPLRPHPCWCCANGDTPGFPNLDPPALARHGSPRVRPAPSCYRARNRKAR
jgi:hypothetical protein